jgi:excisionase family DNA binding protein
MTTKLYIPVKSVARVLGLPATYLRKLAGEGKIPALTVNGRLRFNPDAVREALDSLASKGAGNEQ